MTILIKQKSYKFLRTLTIIGQNVSVTYLTIIKLRWKGRKINVDSHCFGSRCGWKPAWLGYNNILISLSLCLSEIFSKRNGANVQYLWQAWLLKYVCLQDTASSCASLNALNCNGKKVIRKCRGTQTYSSLLLMQKEAAKESKRKR